MVSIVNKNLLRQQHMAVASEDDLVVVQLGNVEVKMPYAAAFQLSQWIRVRAKEAKRFAVDNARHWSVLGTLHDANVPRGNT